jgi:hypothetical protein
MAAALGIVAAASGGSWINLALGRERPAPISAEQGRAPRVVAVEANFDFGRAKQGAPVEHSFVLRNMGQGELIIERAQGS